MRSVIKYIIFTLITVLISLLILSAVYSIIDKKTDNPSTPEKAAEQLKEIETPGKKWLNGYLGIFFRFKYLGNINWLIIPLLIYFFLFKKKPQRWQMALIFAWLLTTLFIMIKGYTNYRYQFTLFPFTATIILLLLWELLKDKKTYLKIFCFTFIGLACVYNIYHYFDRYDFFWSIKVNDEKSHFPFQLINYLNGDRALKESSKKVFVMDQPLFFYYTNQKGIDMQSPEAQWATSHLAKKSISREALFKEFKKILHVEYLLIRVSQLKLYQSLILPEFLDCECHLVLKDNGTFLYRLREIPLERELRSPRFDKFKLWQSQEKKPAKASPWLITFDETGKFNLNYMRKQEKGKNLNYLMLSNITPDEKGERRINCGYELGRNELKIDISRIRGQYLHFITRAAISPSLFNRSNYIFINQYNDQDKTWQSSRTYFSSPYTRSYFVSRHIGQDSSRVVLGFRFNPKSQEEFLLIQDARIYISNEPL